MAELFINYDSKLYEINESLVSQFEELIRIFYAYSRSETKIDEKEEEFKEQILIKEKELLSCKELLSKQSTLATTFREKID